MRRTWCDDKDERVVFMREFQAEVRRKLRVLDGGSYVCCVEETTCVIRRELCVISETTRSTTSGLWRYT